MAACGGGQSGPRIPADQLRSPFLGRGTASTSAAPDAACPSTPAPIAVVDAPDLYSDPTKWLSAVGPLVTYMNSLTEMGDAYVRDGDVGDANCVATWMSDWASAHALETRPVGTQGLHERQYALGGLSATYLKIRYDTRIDAGSKAAIKKWLHSLGVAVMADYNGYSNNHAYWAGFEIALTAIATNDSEMFDWAIQQYSKAIDQLTSDGTLSQEMARAGLQIHYHNFSLDALVFLAETATTQGIDLYAAHDHRIRKLVDLVVATLIDREAIAPFTSDRQDRYPPNIEDLAWMEPYYARFHDDRLVPWLTRGRASNGFFDYRIGGNATLLWGERPAEN